MKQALQISPAYLPQRRHWGIPLLGVLASLLLHALLIMPALLGGTTSGDHSSAGKLAEVPTMMLVFIEQSNPGATPDHEMDYTTSLSSSPGALLSVAIPDLPPPPPALVLGDSEDDQPESGGPGRTALVERYMGQIDARIQRAWVRPRTSIDSGLFVCRVQIAQEQNGRVQEIEIAQCNGDIPWQTSLVHAIQSASPLLAPPDPKVFSHTLTLEFTAHPFSPGSSSEGLEPEARMAPK